jgi:hypothetical protein
MKLRILFALLFFSQLLFSQEKDSLANDSIPNHSIKKAVLFSAIIPSSGQIYNSINMEKGTKGKNKVFWKVPLIYSALGTTGFLLIKNQNTQHSLKTEFNNRYVNNSTTLNEKWKNYDSLGIVTLYNKYSNKRDLSILAFGAIYLIQILDAGIEAHFVKFDISENLTFQIRPKFYNYSSLGLGLCFNFHEKNSLTNFKF